MDAATLSGMRFSRRRGSNWKLPLLIVVYRNTPWRIRPQRGRWGGGLVQEKSIFREAALERLSTPDRLDQGLVIVNSAGGIALAALLLCIVVGTIWAATI